MGDCVEGCREVQEDQNTDVARICSNEEVIGDLDEGVYRAHGWTCAAGVGRQLLFPGFCLGEEGL